MKKDFHLFVIASWMGLSLFCMVFSYRYGLGKLNDPGPGFMPFLTGTILLLISASQMVRSSWPRMGKAGALEEGKSKKNLLKVFIVFSSLFVYAFLLETLGYAVGTCLILIALFWCSGMGRWTHVFIFSILTALITFFVFNYLGVRFPLGVIRVILYGT